VFDGAFNQLCDLRLLPVVDQPRDDVVFGLGNG
jgi:hypothetical protein